MSWCRGFGSGFAQLSCPEAAAPAGGCQSGFCKFILLGFAIKGRFGDQNCSLSCMGFSQWARCTPGMRLQGGDGALPAAFLCAEPGTKVRAPQPELQGLLQKYTLRLCKFPKSNITHVFLILWETSFFSRSRGSGSLGRMLLPLQRAGAGFGGEGEHSLSHLA